MANCGDLERGLQDMNRRIRDLERQLGGGSGGAPSNLDEEKIIKKTLERVFKDNRWMQAVGILGMLSTGKAGITSLGNLQSPASAAFQRSVESLNRSLQASSAAGAARGNAAQALINSLNAQTQAKAANAAGSAARSAANQANSAVKTTNTIAKDAQTTAKNAAGQVQRTADQQKRFEDATKSFQRSTQSELTKVQNAAKNATQNVVKEIDKKTKPLQETAKKLQDSYKKLDNGFQRITKGLDKFANAIGLAFGIAGVAIGFMALFASERNQAAFDRQVNAFNVLASKELGLMQQLKSRIDKVIKRTEILEKEADLASDAIKQNRSIADAAKKMANDITYEARVRLQRLNDGLYVAKVQAARADEATKQFNGKIQQANIEIKKANAEIAKANNEASQARVGVRLVDSKATLAAQDAKQARIGVQLVDSKATTALVTAQQLPAKIPAIVQSQIQPAIAPIKATDAAQDTEIATLKNRVTAIQYGPKVNTGNSTGTGTNAPTINQAQVNQAIVNSGIPLRLNAIETTAQAALARSTAALNKPELEPIGRSAIGLGANNAAAIDKLNQDIQQLKAPNILEPRLRTVETKLQEREKMDAQANQKLDYQMGKLEQLLIATGGIGLMLPKILGGLDGLPDKTATAVAAAPCGGGCGGRTAQRVNDLAGEVGTLRNQVNGLPTLINGANAVANGAQLGLLNTINNKLGSALPNGGIGGILSRMAKSSAADKAMQFATLMMTLHNGFFLSRDLTQSFFSLSSSALNATMRTFGITTADDTPIDVGQIINAQLQEALKALIGAENLVQLNQALASFNRIYQAGANVISNVWSMADSTRNVLEYTAENTGRIGNALKKERVVAPDSYPDMPEKVTARTATQRKLDNIIEGVESLQSGVSALDSTFQEVISINDTVEEYKRSTKEFKDSIEQSPIPEVAANLAVKAKRETERAVSKVPETVADVERTAAEEVAEVA